jgi:NTP pyrophosphatase (non-canonical NTP hydrolase)
LAEEQFELIEALIEKDREHIIEEMADNIHIIWQFADLYRIDIDEILKVVRMKNERTLERMEVKDE